ncbi:hypothetical protein LMG29542_03694 [Paraburkholderia humisilvae]|uniref:Uncharacterized protein n=1 Tax=Paraburkholderia humisilvae TaxID=627669 RepID=A0A6J5E464_9BURK|nr:hypothetical protein LMG29542_03694 [Paraburkholderia humisilvae]
MSIETAQAAPPLVHAHPPPASRPRLSPTRRQAPRTLTRSGAR